MAKDEFEFTFDLNQWKTFFETVQELPANVGQNAFKAAMRRGLERIQWSAKSELGMKTSGSPYTTGRLMNAIKIKQTSKYQPYFWKGSVYIPEGKTREDKSGAYYAHMVEFGHKLTKTTKSGSFKKKVVVRNIPPYSFMRNGIKLAEDHVIQNFRRNAMIEIEKRWNRLPVAQRPTAYWKNFGL